MHQAKLLARGPQNRAEGDNPKALKFGAPGEIRTHALCLGAGWRARQPISESQWVGAAALLWRSSKWRTIVSPRRTIVSARRSIVGRWTIVSRGRTIVSRGRSVVSRGLSVEPRAWCAAKAVL